MDWKNPSTMYDTIMFRSNGDILINAQQVMCQGNVTGTALEYAQENMYNMGMVDETALDEDCNSNELQQKGVHSKIKLIG